MFVQQYLMKKKLIFIFILAIFILFYLIFIFIFLSPLILLGNHSRN